MAFAVSRGKPEGGREGKEDAGWRGGGHKTRRAEIEEQRVGECIPGLAFPGLTFSELLPRVAILRRLSTS